MIIKIVSRYEEFVIMDELNKGGFSLKEIFERISLKINIPSRSLLCTLYRKNSWLNKLLQQNNFDIKKDVKIYRSDRSKYRFSISSDKLEKLASIEHANRLIKMCNDFIKQHGKDE